MILFLQKNITNFFLQELVIFMLLLKTKDHPTNKSIRIKITTQHLQNANTKQRLRTQNDADV